MLFELPAAYIAILLFWIYYLLFMFIGPLKYILKLKL